MVPEVLARKGAEAHGMSGRVVARALGAVVFASAVSAMTALAQQPPALQDRPREDLIAYLPPGEGKALVVSRCTVCHDLRGMMQLRKAPPGWEAIVLDMGARGAPITLDDIDPLVKYLSTAFGPEAPPFTDVNSASKAELTKLPGVAPEAADRLIARRGTGPLTSAEQVRTAFGLNTQAFDKIKYYVYVKPAAPAKRQ